MGEVLKLSDAARDKVQELQRLSDEAEGGGPAARRELRRAVRESAPEVIACVSDTAGAHRRLLAKTLSAGDPLRQEGLERRCELMEENVAGPNPTPLEELLAERVVSCWLLTDLMEALVAAQLSPATERRVSPSYLLHMVKLQESANRRYLAAIKALAQVRKLQSNTPVVQVNTQINVGGGE